MEEAETLGEEVRLREGSKAKRRGDGSQPDRFEADHARVQSMPPSHLTLALGSGTYDPRVSERRPEPLNAALVDSVLLRQLSAGRGSNKADDELPEASDSHLETATVGPASEAGISGKRHAKRGKSSGAAAKASNGLSCDHCGRKNSPAWRKGPPHAPRLCNACGTRFAHRKTLEGYLPGMRQREEETYAKPLRNRSPAVLEGNQSPGGGNRAESPTTSHRSPLTEEPSVGQEAEWVTLVAEAKLKWHEWRTAAYLLAEAVHAAKSSSEAKDRSMAPELERAQRLFWTNKTAAATLLDELSDVEVLFALSTGSTETTAGAREQRTGNASSWQSLLVEAHALGAGERPQKVAKLLAKALSAVAAAAKPNMWLMERLQAVLQLLSSPAGSPAHAAAFDLLTQLQPHWGECQSCGKRRLLGRRLKTWESFRCGDSPAMLRNHDCDAPEDVLEDWAPQSPPAEDPISKLAGNKRRRPEPQEGAQLSELDLLATAAEAELSGEPKAQSKGARTKRARHTLSVQGSGLERLPVGWQCHVAVSRLQSGLSTPEATYVCPVTGLRVNSVEEALLVAEGGAAAAAGLRGKDFAQSSPTEATLTAHPWTLRVQPATPRITAKLAEHPVHLTTGGASGAEWSPPPNTLPSLADVSLGALATAAGQPAPLPGSAASQGPLPSLVEGVELAGPSLPAASKTGGTTIPGWQSRQQGFKIWVPPADKPSPAAAMEEAAPASVRIVTSTPPQPQELSAVAPTFPGFSRGFSTVTTAAGLEAAGSSPEAVPSQTPVTGAAAAPRQDGTKKRRVGKKAAAVTSSVADAAATLASAPSMTDLPAQGLRTSQEGDSAKPAPAVEHRPLVSQASTESFRFPEHRQQLGRAISDPQVLKRELERGWPHEESEAATPRKIAPPGAKEEKAGLTMDEQWQQLCARQQQSSGSATGVLAGRPLGRAISDPASLQSQLAEALGSQTGYLPAATSLVTWQAAVTLVPREGLESLELFSLVAALPVRLAAALPSVIRVSQFKSRSQIYMAAVADKPLLLRLGPVDERQRGAVVHMEELKLAAVAHLDGFDLALIPHINSRNSLHIVGLKMDQGGESGSQQLPRPSQGPTPAAVTAPTSTVTVTLAAPATQQDKVASRTNGN